MVDSIQSIYFGTRLNTPGESPVVQMVHLVGFAGSSIDINLYYFTKTVKWAEWRSVIHRDMINAEWRSVIHRDMIAFKRIVESEGAAFAFPSQSLYLESTPSEAKVVNEVGRKGIEGEDVMNTRSGGFSDDGDGGDG